MIEYSNTLGGGGSSTATLPDQISNLACTGGTDGSHGTIDVSFTEVPATSFDLLKYYILICKAGGIPQTPFDGVRITLQKGTAGAKLEYQITGLTFDQLYGVRVYPVSVKNQYQTLAEGATATATPIAEISLGDLMADVEVDRIKGIENDPEAQFLVLEHNYGGLGYTLVRRVSPYGNPTIWNSGYNTYSTSNVDDILSNTYINEIKEKIRNVIPNNTIYYTPGNGNYNLSSINKKIFLLSGNEYNVPSSYENEEGNPIKYFGNMQHRATAAGQWTRTPSRRDHEDPPSSDTPNRIVVHIDRNGNKVRISCFDNKKNIYPAFTLPPTTVLRGSPDIDGAYIAV